MSRPDSLLLDLGPGTFDGTDSRLTRMNPNRALLLLAAGRLAHLLGRHVLQVDGQPVRVVLGVSQDLGRVQAQDGLGDDGRGFVEKVGIVDPEGLVIPVDFPGDQGLGDEPEGEDDPFDFGSLLILLRKVGLFVAAARVGARCRQQMDSPTTTMLATHMVSFLNLCGVLVPLPFPPFPSGLMAEGKTFPPAFNNYDIERSHSFPSATDQEIVRKLEKDSRSPSW